MPTTRNIASPELEDIVGAVNDLGRRFFSVEDKVRQLEFRVDQFTPATINTTVVPNAKYVWGGLVLGFAIYAGAVYVVGKQQAKKDDAQ